MSSKEEKHVHRKQDDNNNQRGNQSRRAELAAGRRRPRMNIRYDARNAALSEGGRIMTQFRGRLRGQAVHRES